MPTCPYCGKETAQPDATYCTYCGSSLLQQGSVARSAPIQTQPSQPTYSSGGGSADEFTQLYEKTLKRIEQLTSIIVLLSVAAVILVLA